MPKTIVQIVTMMCPTGLGNPNASCRFHRASDNMTPNGKCPTCNLVLVKATDPRDKITKTVIGEEDIEIEIEQIKDRKQKQEKGHEKDPDLSNKKKEDDHRDKRKEDIRLAIIEAKKLEDL